VFDTVIQFVVNSNRFVLFLIFDMHSYA